MNIAFWSMTSGRSATSGNMLAVSVMSSLAYSIEETLVQIDQHSRSIDDVFGERRQTNLLMEEYSYYTKKGLDSLIDKCQLDELSLRDLDENIVPVKDTYIRYIPVSKRTTLGINNRELTYFSKKIFDVLNQSNQLNFIDCINGDTPVSKMILREADVVVINLSQGMTLSSLNIDKEILKKSVFLIGKYDGNSKENISHISKKYGIDRNDIAIIPYNIQFSDAIHEGKIVSYISKGMNSRISDENVDFINKVYLATNMILRKAGYDNERMWSSYRVGREG